MSHDGLPVRAQIGARAASTDRPSVPGASPPGPTHLIGRIATIGAITAFAFAACSGSSGTAAPGASGTSAASTPGSSIASPEASPSASAPTRIVVQVFAQNNSKVTGGAVLSDLGDGSTAVTVGVIAIGFTDPMPAQIVSGNCASMAGLTPSAAPSGAASMTPSVVPSVVPSAPAGASGSPGPSASVDPNGPFPLKDVTGGSSNTVVPTTLSNLLAQPFAIVIHKSAADPTVVACADITAAGIAVPSGLESAMPSSLPSLPAASSSP